MPTRRSAGLGRCDEATATATPSVAHHAAHGIAAGFLQPRRSSNAAGRATLTPTVLVAHHRGVADLTSHRPP